MGGALGRQGPLHHLFGDEATTDYPLRHQAPMPTWRRNGGHPVAQAVGVVVQHFGYNHDQRRRLGAKGEKGQIDPERTFAEWSLRHPARVQQYRFAILRAEFKREQRKRRRDEEQALRAMADQVASEEPVLV